MIKAYTKKQCEKFIQNYKHIVNQSCYPHGKDGAKYIITGLEILHDPGFSFADVVMAEESNKDAPIYHAYAKIKNVTSNTKEKITLKFACKLLKVHFHPEEFR